METAEQEENRVMVVNSLVCFLLGLSFFQPSKRRTNSALMFNVPIFIAMLLSTDYSIGYLMSNNYIARPLVLYLGDIGSYYVFHALVDLIIITLLARVGNGSKQLINLFVLSILFFLVNVIGFAIWALKYEPQLYNNAAIALYLMAMFILIDRRTTRDRLQGLINKHRFSFGNDSASNSVLHKSKETFK